MAQIAVLLHLAPLHSLLTPQALSPAQVATVHLALLQRPLASQLLSPVQAAVGHLAPLHSLLTPQALSPAQVATVHLAPLHSLLARQVLSPVQAGPAVHFAVLHSLLTPQVRSSPQAFALHFTLVHTAPDEVQSVSTEQADAAPQTTLPPQKALVVQISPLFTPEGQVRVQMPLVAPQMPLSQSAAL